MSGVNCRNRLSCVRRIGSLLCAVTDAWRAMSFVVASMDHAINVSAILLFVVCVARRFLTNSSVEMCDGTNADCGPDLFLSVDT